VRVLIATFGSLGDLNPYLALARGLAARGHEPILATHAYYREIIESEGFELRPVRPDADPDDRELFARAMRPRRGSEVVVREIVLPHLRESYDDTAEAARDADAIVTHPLTFAGRIVAEERGLPWVSTVLAPLSFFSRSDFPIVPPMPNAWRLYGIPGMTSLLARLFHRITRRWTRPVRELRAERGLPPGDHPLFEGQHSPLLTLGLFSRVLAEPQPDWPPSTRLTGFLFQDPPAASDDPEEARLAAFLEAGAAPAVFTLGSSAVAVAGTFYDESLAAARRLGLRSVLLLGADPRNRPTAELDEDALALERAPYQRLFPAAAAIVHHGGIGTLAQALHAGRPMLVVPHAHDQPDNAHRAARLGVARVLSPRRYRAKAVEAALRALVEDPAVADRAAAVGRIVRAEDGVAEASRTIEEAVRGA
jgi:UDP:flavonoid glycosyltransferase YjiC (YdhE family)